ncbi:MAG: hypothetical protein SFV81_03790 [Pirellulaceae bacterium]|nr:hypothetical protein [Pirellulaceae bacterium]
MIAWCGTRADGLGWLSQRCEAVDSLEVADGICTEAIDAICNLHPRRLILSIENRLDYPLAEIGHLQCNWPEIPWALAVGSWFDGARRTGMGATSHLSLPWYRWWDGWRPWLSGSNAELLNPWPKAALSGCAANMSLTGAMEFSQAAGLIVCNCSLTAEGWQAGLNCDPARVKRLTLGEFQGMLSQASSQVSSKASSETADWILWDDSCLDTFAGARCTSDIGALFAQIRERFPAAKIVAATCMPRWSDWQQWEAAGADELIAKPTSINL